MRLTADRVRAAILHSDKDVREAAVHYFALSYSPDTALMPLVIAAIERFGLADAFASYRFMADLAQTDETVRWLIRQIGEEKSPVFVQACSAALSHADPALLGRHEDTIMGLDFLDSQARDAISERICFLSTPPARLWADLEKFCREREDEESTPDEDFAYACRLVEALGRHPDEYASRVLSILSGDTGDFDNWTEGFAVRLAGEMKLKAAIPWLVEMLNDPGDWLHEECHRALVQIGGDAVVAQLTRDYARAGWNLRISTASILEDIHEDRSVQASLDLLQVEPEHEIRCLLLQAILMNFSDEGIEPARQFILTTPLDPEVLEVRTALLTACKLMEVGFPEFDAWLKDSENDQAFRRRWHQEHSRPLESEEAATPTADVPGWLDALVETVAGAMTTQAVPGSLGLRYREEEGAWEVLVYPLPVELVGGAHDGSVVSPGFSLDVEQVRVAFSRVDAVNWQAHPFDEDEGPEVSIEGEYAGREVWLRILAFAPGDEEPGFKVDVNRGM